MQINPLDIRVEVIIGGTAWSRTTNTVKVTHTPTGISTQCGKHRGQHANKQEAFQELVSFLTKQTDFTKQMELEFN